MIKKILNALSPIFNSLVFLSLSIIIIEAVWFYFGKDYVFPSRIIGSDYYNALTYLIYFNRYLPHPATGWLPFWNEGAPVIGGYPFLTFYLIQPLTKYFDLLTSMNYYSFFALVLFFIASLLLFWQISKNWILAIGLVVILLTTRASYYELTTGGFISSASTHWYLPLILLFIYKFGQNVNFRFLILASIFSGISLLHHAPSNIIMVFIPSIVFLALGPNHKKPISQKLKNLALFTAISLLIGSVGLYAVFLQSFMGSGTGQCASSQCWGEYPLHFVRWLTPISPSLALLGLLAVSTIKFFKKDRNLSMLLPSIGGFFFFVVYIALAYFKLINGLANVLFPTRIFWAVNLYLLLITATAFYLIQKVSLRIAYFLALIIVLTTLLIIIQKPTNIHKEFTSTVPQEVEKYTNPKFKTRELSEVVPAWVLQSDPNWRLDIASNEVNHWFYLITKIPMTRGYSNHPLGSHRDWQYFLTVSTRNIEHTPEQELIKNRALFLADSFGIGIISNFQSKYPEFITGDPEIILRKTTDPPWYQLSEKYSSPIVSPTNTSPVLFIGNDQGYNQFIRSIAMTNLNSNFLIPVKGPQSLSKISKKDLQTFRALVLYRYQGQDFEKLTKFVKDGGKVFIETGSSKPELGQKLPDIFPFESLNQQDVSGKVDWRTEASKLTDQIDFTKFSPLIYQGGPWKIFTPGRTKTRSWAKTVLYVNNQLVLAEGNLGSGYVIASGLNLPFHAVDNNNLEGSKLFKNIIIRLIDHLTSNDQPDFKVVREKPETIHITGKNFNGIYFKENYHPGWQAYVNNKKTEVYKAGLDFMYIPASNGQEVSIVFKGGLLNWSLYWLTIASLIVSIIFLLFPKSAKFLLFPIHKIWRAKITEHLKRWVEEEYS